MLSGDGVWWRARSACIDAPLQLVDDAYAKPGGPRARKFKEHFCSHCPVAEECLREALEKGEWGVWGATSNKWRTQHGGASPTLVRYSRGAA
jgi:hypothetical protein